MKTIYPSNNFLANVKSAIHEHEALEISVRGGWRGRILAKEVEQWLPFNQVEFMKQGNYKAPSSWCGLLMMSLHATHYMALSADYELQSSVDGDFVVLTYVPL